MPQKLMECFRLLFDHLAWIEHQFLSGIRDSRKAWSLWGMMRCRRSKEVRTPDLIGQIKNFMDKDRRVSIKTISAQFDVSVGTVHTIIREELKVQKICAKFVPMQLVLLNLSIGPYQVLPFRAIVGLGAMAMKGCPHSQSSSSTGTSPSDLVS